MGAGSNNLMSTQTGGVGETIQAENTTQATPEEFQANIPPVQAETPQTEVPSEVPAEQVPMATAPTEGPLPAEEQLAQEQLKPSIPMVPTEEPMVSTETPIETETDVINRLGLENIEPAFNGEQSANSIVRPSTTPDGIPVANTTPPIKEEEEEPIIKDEEEEEVVVPSETPDGIPVGGPKIEKQRNLADVNAKYKNDGIQVDDLGKVFVGTDEQKNAQVLPDGSYRLAGNSANYQKVDGQWYKDPSGTGDYQPIGGENVDARIKHLEENAQGTISETQKKAGEIINQRFGDMRKEVEGNRVAENNFTFNDFTKGKSTSNTQQYNADGTANFNYDPNAAKTKETFGVDTEDKGELSEGVYKFPGSEASYKRIDGDWLIDPKGGVDFVPITKGNVAYRKAKLDTDAVLQAKPDGVYIYPGSKASYKRVNGDWMIDPAGGSNYVQMTQGDVDKRKAQLDLSAVKAVKAGEFKDLGAIIKKEGIGSTVAGVPSLPSVEQSIIEKTAKKSEALSNEFSKAKNFANTDIMSQLTLKGADGMPIQVLTGDQMTSFLEHQNKIKDIIGDGAYTPAKAAKVEQAMKEAETYFNEAKQINAEINKARAEDKSLSRVSFEKKMEMADDLLTDSDEYTMFATTANMADFVLDNVDNGKMRFDAEAGQYVISPSVSGTERQYLESKLGEYIDYYTSLQGEKYAEAQTKIQDDRQKLSATKRNIVKLESSLAEMKRNGVDEKSAEYKAVVSELDKSKTQADDYDALIDKKIYATDAAFLTEPKKTAQVLALSLSTNAYDIIAAIPKDITPKQQFDLIYERLAAENDKLAKKYGLNTEGLGNANMKVKDMVDWDGFYALSKEEKQWLQNKATLNQMSPLYFNNSDMLSNEGTGFWESFTNSFYSTLFPTTAKAEGFTNLSEASATSAQKLQEFGFKDEDYVTPEMAKKLEEQSKVDFWGMEKWGGMVGTTAAIIAPMMLTAGVPSTALRVVKGVEGLITGANVTKTAKIVANAERIYENALKATKFGRFLKPSIESAVKAEIAGDIFTSQEDELNFLSFMAGGVVSESLGAVFAKMPKDQVYKYLQGIFGNKVNLAINTIKKGGEATARGIGETGEETMQELVGVYQRTDSWQEMKAELNNQFGTLDQVQEFLVSSFIMGAGFGLTESKTAKDTYAKLPPQSKEQVDAAIEAIRADLNEADGKVEEYAENKGKQQKVEQTIEENDKKDEQGVSGQVGEGQKPVEGQPVAESSQEATSPSGVVQKEQEVEKLRADEQAELAQAIPNIDDYKVNGEIDKASMPEDVLAKYNEIYDKYDAKITPLLPTSETTTTEAPKPPKIQKATAKSVEEAQELVKQGYVPADKKLSKNDISNIFNTRKKLNMVKIEEAPAVETPAAEDIKNKSIEELEKRQAELEGAKSFTEEAYESAKIERELEKREWQSVLNAPLSDVNGIVNGLMVKDKEMPNGYGTFIEKSDARQTKEVAEKYSKEVSKEEAKKDFKDAFFGNPSSWYADGLKLRESVRAYVEQGGSFKELLDSVKREFNSDGFSEEEAAGVINNKLNSIKNKGLEGDSQATEPATTTETPVSPSETTATETTAEPTVEKTDAFKKVAAAIRKGKIDSSGMAMAGIVPVGVFNKAIEGLALTVENIGKIVENVRNSDWYKGLNEQVKKAVDRGLDKTLKSSTKEGGLTDEQVANEAYKNEFKIVYDRLLQKANKTGDLGDINNLNSFVNDPRAFIEDNILDNPINSGRTYEFENDFGLSRDRFGGIVSDWENKVKERIQKVEDSLSSDRKTLANNEIISNKLSASIEYALEDLSAADATQEDIDNANEILADPVKHLMEMYEYASEFHDEKTANEYLQQAQAIKATYEKYGVDTGLSQEQSNQIDELADSVEDTAIEEPKLTKEQEKAKKKADREAERQRLKEFKENVAKATGTAKQPKTVQMTESEALRKQLKDKEKAGKETRIWMNKMRNDILDYAKKNLPKGEYTNAELNKITAALKAKDLEAALDRIDAIIAKKNESTANRDAKAAERKRKATIKNIKDTIKSKRTILSLQGGRWVGKTTVEAQKEYFKFINNVNIDELDGKTQEELDEISDIIDGIVSEGKADYKRLKELDADAKRQRAAALIQGLAKGKGTILNSVDEIMNFFKGGQVVIDGRLYNKSSFRQLINKDTQKGKQGEKVEAIEEEIVDLKRDYEIRLEEVMSEGGTESTDPDLKAITKKIAAKNKQLSTAQAKYDSMPDANVDVTGATGYKQENSEMAKLSERTKGKKILNKVINFLTPAKAINDLYSLYTKTWSKSTAVARFVKDNIMEPVKKAYVERDIAYSKKVNEYYEKLDEIFGKYPLDKTKQRAGVSARGAKAVDKLSESVDGIVTSDVAQGVNITNSHVIDYYNLAQTKDGVERLEKSGVDVDAVIAHVEGDAQLKKYADFLMEKYKELGVEYEPTYVAYTGTPFPSGDFPYYPANASDYSQDFVNEGDLMGDDGAFNMMNATSNNMKAKRNFQGNFNIAMDAHAKYLDYVKNMEHAKHFMPIAKKVNELFSTINAPHLIKSLGIDDYNDIKSHTARVLSNQNIGGVSSPARKFLMAIRNYTVVTTLGFKPSSLAKQFVGFTHYWVAGIDKGLDPLQIWKGAPVNKDELELAKDIIGSDYIKERLTGQHIDVEMRRLMEQSQNSTSAKVWSKFSQAAMAPVRYGDKFALLFGPGGGLFFATASYRHALSEGMTHEEAKAYAMEQFITETELSQQSTRADLTSNIQIDETFRMLGMYRTGQMAAAKKVVTGMRTIYQANRMQKEEGIEARREAISDREIVKASVDITYYTLAAALLFSVISNGAIAVLMGDDEDEKKRALHDTGMDAIGSFLQGYGMTGYVLDGVLNHLRGDEWKDNVPILKTLTGLYDAGKTALKASDRTWQSMSESERKYFGDKEKLPETMWEEDLIGYMNKFNDRNFTNKLTESEYDKITKAVGLKNVSDLVSNIGEWMDGAKDLTGAIMNWDTDYMEKNTKNGKDDMIFEMFYGIPYIEKMQEDNVDKVDYGIDEETDIFKNKPGETPIEEEFNY